MTFQLDPGADGNIDSAVSINDVGYGKLSFLQATLWNTPTSSKKHVDRVIADLHVYDATGNHTGPTSDSTWVADIPGSRFELITDSLGNTHQLVFLPPALDAAAYTFEVESRGDIGEVSLAFKDASQGGRTMTGVFEGIALDANTQVSTTLQQVSPDIVLAVDQDGDGISEDSLDADAYQQVHLIEASAGPGGSISPSGLTATNYADTLLYSIEPDAGYEIDDVLVDSISQGATGTYTFEHIENDHNISVTFVKTSNVSTETPQELTYKLDRNYPNPFSETTSITFEIPATQHVTLKVFDILGREVDVLHDAITSRGIHTVTFDGSNHPSGTYFYRFEAGEYNSTKRFVILR